MATRPKSIRAEEALWERLDRVVAARGEVGESANSVVVALVEEFLEAEEPGLGLDAVPLPC